MRSEVRRAVPVPAAEVESAALAAAESGPSVQLGLCVRSLSEAAAVAAAGVRQLKAGREAVDWLNRPLFFPPCKQQHARHTRVCAQQHTHTHSERSKVMWFTLTSLDGALLMVKLLEDSSSNNRSLNFDLSAQIIIKYIYICIYHHGNKMDDNKSRCWRC